MRLRSVSGLTLIELLIAFVVGAAVVAGAIKLFGVSSQGRSDINKINTLNRDLRSMLDLMLRDIRRTGYLGAHPDSDADGKIDAIFKNNPFNEFQIDDDASCIVYAYNKNSNAPPVENNERFGFKLMIDKSFSPPKKVLKVRRSAPSLPCHSGSWENMTAPDVVITALTFTLTETLFNITSAINSPAAPIVHSCNPGDQCLSVRQVDVRLSGYVTDDPAIKQTVAGSVKIRNDYFAVR